MKVRRRFARCEPRVTAGFVAGLLAGVERKTCWLLADHAAYW